MNDEEEEAVLRSREKHQSRRKNETICFGHDSENARRPTWSKSRDPGGKKRKRRAGEVSGGPTMPGPTSQSADCESSSACDRKAN